MLPTTASFKPGETKENTIYLAVSSSFLVLALAWIPFLFDFALDANFSAALLILLAPIVSSILFYSRWDKHHTHRIIEENIDKTDIERFVVRLNFLFETWHTNITTDVSPLTQIDLYTQSVVEGTNLRSDVWAFRIATWIRIIIANLFLTMIPILLTPYQTLSFPPLVLPILAVLGIVCAIRWFWINRKKDWLLLQFSMALYFLIVLFISCVLISNHYILHVEDSLTNLALIVFFFLGIVNYLLIKMQEKERVDAIQHASILLRLRLLQSYIKTEPIIRMVTDYYPTKEDSLVGPRGVIEDQLKLIDDELVLKNWSIVTAQEKRLREIVCQIADETSDGRRKPRNSIYDEVIHYWNSILKSKDPHAWARFLWVREILRKWYELGLPLKEEIVLVSILRLNPIELSSPYYYKAITGEEFPDFEYIPDIENSINGIVESNEFSERPIIDFDGFLKQYILDIKKWKYEYLEETIKNSNLYWLSHTDVRDAIMGIHRKVPDSPRHLIALSFELESQGKFLEAIIAIDKAVLKGLPKNAALFHKSELALKSNQVDLAYELISEYLEYRPQNADALFLYALINSMRNEPPDEIEKTLKRVLEIDSVHEEALSMLAALKFDKSEVKEGMELLLRALALNEENTMALYTLSAFAVKANQPILVENTYTKILKANPNDAFAMIRLGLVYLSKGLLEKASDLFVKAYDIGRELKTTYDRDLELSLAGLAFVASKQNKNELKLDYAKKTIALLDEIFQRTTVNTSRRHFQALQRLIKLSEIAGDQELASFFEQELESLQPSTDR